MLNNRQKYINKARINHQQSIKKNNGKRGKRFLFSEYTNITPEIKRIIVSAMMFLIAAVMILSLFDQAGLVGASFKRIIISFIGFSAFLGPLFFILLGLISLTGSFKKHLSALILGMILLIIGTSMIFYHFVNVQTAGGFIGSFIFGHLEQILDLWVSLLIAFVLVIVGLIIIYKDLKADQKTWIYLKKIIRCLMIHKIVMAKIKEKEIDVSSIGKTDQDQFLLEDKKKESFPLTETDKSSIKKIQIETKPLSPKIMKKIETETCSFNVDLFESDLEKPVAQSIDKNLHIIKKTLENFSISVEMGEVNIGPTVTQYTLKPPQGIKLSKIVSLSNDLALALASPVIMIHAPVPGTNLIGIQVPNKERALVRMRPLLEVFPVKKLTSFLIIALGRDAEGRPIFLNLEKMPHLLVAGMTGSGKTICLHSIILSLLFKNSPYEVRLILMDFKRVEFLIYEDIPHLIGPVIYDVHQADQVLKWLVEEMEARFHLLQKTKSKNIVSYNQKMLEQETELLPYIVLIIDELANLIIKKGKEAEFKIVRLCQMARAVGIHLVVSTQRPSVEIVTGLIKANIAARIALTVASQIDSRTILDSSGAEKLLSKGDILYITPQLSKPNRAQGVYLSELEIKKAVDCLKSGNFAYLEDDFLSNSLMEVLERKINGDKESNLDHLIQEDSLYSEALSLVVRSKKASASLLQRHLKIGYARAARLIDMLEQEGIIGPGEGAKPRQILGIQSDLSQIEDDDYQKQNRDQVT